MLIDVIHQDDYKVFDKMIQHAKKNNVAGPVGWVKLFMNNKFQWEGPNLIVGQGRGFVAQKLFGIHKSDTGTLPDLTNYKISHFAVGSGGATISGTDWTPIGPTNNDTHLNTPIPLGDDAFLLTEPSGGATSPHCVKPINYSNGVPVTSNIYIEPANIEGTNYYTKVKCTCVVESNEPTSLSSGESVLINEAGLYITDGNGQSPKMFSHICFAPKWKELESEFAIWWYILC